MEKTDLLIHISEIIKKPSNEIRWIDICKYTKFDSFVTLLAIGLNWIKDSLDKQKRETLNIILFNLVNFAK